MALATAKSTSLSDVATGFTAGMACTAASKASASIEQLWLTTTGIGITAHSSGVLQAIFFHRDALAASEACMCEM